MTFKFDQTKTVYEELCGRCKTEDGKIFFKWFCLLNEIPRQSGNRKPVTDWLISVAKEHGIEYKVDEELNVVMYIPGSEGKEHLKSVVLQGHVDMVGTVKPGYEFDFSKDPIKMIVKGELLVAEGTTLGGDDGSGIACMLYIMETHKQFEHGPVELLFTVDEETGLIGACGLKPGELLTKNAKYLINIDSEDWGVVTISSAGTAMRTAFLKAEKEEIGEGFTKIQLKLDNLVGGHTGIMIHCDHANAIKWMNTLLIKSRHVVANDSLRFVTLKGGHAHNAIPSTAYAEIIVENEKCSSLIEDIWRLHIQLMTYHRHVEIKYPRLIVEKVKANPTEQCVRTIDSLNCMHFIDKVPHGVFRFSPAVPKLVETSQSLSIVELTAEEGKPGFAFTVFMRSSNNQYMNDASKSFEYLCKLHTATVTIPHPDVGGWPANPDSKLLQVTKEIFKKDYGKEIEVTAIHAGLENSMIMEKYQENDLESISIGPTIKNPHSFEESMDIQSSIDCCDFVKRIVSELATN